MSDTIENSITDIKMAYRLILHSKLIEAKNKGDSTAEKAAKAELDKDEAQISDSARAAHSASGSSADEIPEPLNIDIHLSELIKELKNVEKKDNSGQTTQVMSYEETVETQASLKYYTLEKIDGLVLKNRSLAETDRYRFEFSDGSSLKITDKWSNRSTTIWGDPHVDTSDEEGANNGDFKDLTSSDQYTTFMLSDGTRLTITAKDNGIIEEVNIFKGSQHISGIGSGSKSWNEENALFVNSVKNDACSSASTIPVGDVVYSGGDGNDWFDAAKNLVWGTTTGPVVTTRPSSYIEFEYNQRITQSLSVMQVNQAA